MSRSPNSKIAERINTTLILLRKETGKEKIILELLEQYGVSHRQAYRYIQEAQKTRRKLPIPEEKEVFTVKLPKSLVLRIRDFGRLKGETLSRIVSQALEIYLKRRKHG